MSLWDAVAGLEVEVDGVRRERLTFQTVRWERVSTVVVLSGGGAEGRGEDVSYATSDQDAHQRMDPPRLAGRRSLADWSELLDGVNLFPVPPAAPEARDYRRWAYESALLDLGLRQAGRSFAQAVGRAPAPVRFCASPSGGPDALLRRFPDTELKIDAQAGWTGEEMTRLARTDRVRVVDLKGHYSGDWNRHPDDPPAFAAAVAEAFPAAVLEDPWLGPAMDGFVAEHAARLAFDAPVHSLEQLLELPRTGWCNIKPSRFATVAGLLECVEHCEANGIGMYGGGQFELGPGRLQIQAIASAFYADGPNDVAPGVYNAAELPADLPASPLPPVDAPGLG